MKPVIAYFSCTGTTKAAAEKLSHVLQVPAFEIKAQTPYTTADLNWHDDQSRANQEQNDPMARPTFEPLSLPDFDVLFLGYPTWWGIPPRVVESFAESLDLKDKTVVPFATSGSSAPEKGGRELAGLLKDAKVLPASRVNGWSETQFKQLVDNL